MLQERFLMHTFVVMCVFFIQANANLNRENIAVSAPATVYTNQETWQPVRHKNWIILQTTAATLPTQVPVRKKIRTYKNPNLRPQLRLHSGAEGLPVNYYAYNHTNGNYHLPTTDMKVVEPYVVAIRSMGGGDLATAVFSKRKISVPISSSTIQNDIISNNVVDTTNSKEVAQDIDRRKVDDAAHITVFEGVADSIAAKQLNEILLPIQTVLDKVKYFCDIAGRLIGDFEDEEADDNNSLLDSARASATITAASPYVLQGRSSSNVPLLAKSPQTASLSVGTGRKVKKIKKKLKKFLVPLLIAYKLKFLTLIPVLIGGLILLVGTTGLAGFFFALFTAVMSLKATGASKSIVIKKI